MGATNCKCRTCADEGDIAPAVEPIKFALADRCVEDLLLTLFSLHDLNKNGILEEIELVQLNKKIAMLHHGTDVDKNAVKHKFEDIYRSKLEQGGEPVTYFVYRKYMLQELGKMDADKLTQTMILEQFIAEANLARAAFHVPSMQSESDAPFVGMISFDEALPISATFGQEKNCLAKAPSLDGDRHTSASPDNCCPSRKSRAVCGVNTCESFGYPSSRSSSIEDVKSVRSPASTHCSDSDSEVIPGSPTISADSLPTIVESASELDDDFAPRGGPWL